jgi:hypothetical protein
MGKNKGGAKPARSSGSTKTAGIFSTDVLLIAVALLVLPLAVNYELLSTTEIDWVTYDDDTVRRPRMLCVCYLGSHASRM